MSESILGKRYGWRRDLPDHRDLLLGAPPPHLLDALPASVDMRPGMPPVYDQGQLGSCTANATAGAVQFARMKAKQGPDFVPSRLFIYHGERVIEHTVNQDSGAQIRDGVKFLAKAGVCPEPLWPYRTTDFALRPLPSAYAEAAKHRVKSYRRVTPRVDYIRAALAGGDPVAFGFTVYESFEDAEVARTGVVPMPSPTEGVLGGHAVLAVGYDHAAQRFLVRNSWGAGWGLAGYFWLPYGFIVSGLADDFWVVQVVST